MPTKEGLMKSIARNKDKLEKLEKRITADEEKLAELEAAEIKMLMNEIDATGISTKEILKAIKNGDHDKLEQLLKGEQENNDTNTEAQETMENDI